MSKQTAFRSAASEWRVWRFLGFAHLSGILIFLGVMAGFLWYVERVENRERQEALYRDIEWAQQSLRLHLRESRDNLARSAPVWVAVPGTEIAGPQRAARISRERSAGPLHGVRRSRPDHPMGGHGARHRARPRPPGERTGSKIRPATSPSAPWCRRCNRSSRRRSSACDNEVLVELHTPVIKDQTLTGVLITGYRPAPLAHQRRLGEHP